MDLWLDDERSMPIDFDYHARSAPAAIAHLKEYNGRMDKVSLDHDLGAYEGNGYDVAAFIEQSAHDNTLAPFDIFVHTANPVAGCRMMMALRNAQRFWEEHTGERIVLRQLSAELYKGQNEIGGY